MVVAVILVIFVLVILVLVILLMLPKDMVVYPKFQLQLTEFLQGKLFFFQHAINALGGKHLQFSAEHIVHFVSFIGDNEPHRLHGQRIHDRFHRDIAGEVPKLLIPMVQMEGMAEQAMQNHVQIGAIDKHAVAQIALYEVAWVKQYLFAVCPDVQGGKVHFVPKTAECQIKKAHGKVKLVTRCA